MSSNCGYNNCFKGISNINEDLLLNILESNFKMYLDWSFLNIGAWFDVNLNDNSIYGVNNHFTLVPVSDPAYADGMVWQGIRKDWVWETDIIFNSTYPITPVSTVKVNNSPVLTTDFIVNYPLGRVIFNSPISTSSTVTASYSYRFIQTHRSSDSPWFNIIQYSSFNTSNNDIQLTDSGEWAIGANHRIQLPAIVIESLPRSRSRPYEIGNTLLWLEQDIGFYVLAENKNDRNKILDILRLQQDATIQLYDTNLVSKDDLFPLDYNGNIKNIPLMYPDLIDQYPWRKCFIKNINIFEMESPHINLHTGLVRMTMEIIST